jgi:hypothetical protein
MQGIYIYIHEKNHVPKEYNVAAILSLPFMVPISLGSALALMYFYISTFRSMCAVPSMTVFCNSLTSWFPGMVLMLLLLFTKDLHLGLVPGQLIILRQAQIHLFYINILLTTRLMLRPEWGHQQVSYDNIRESKIYAHYYYIRVFSARFQIYVIHLYFLMVFKPSLSCS